LCQQLGNYEKQVESIQIELDHARSRYTTCCREMDDMRRKLSQRDDAIICQESRLEELKFELKEKEKCCQRNIECLQDKLSQANEQLCQRDQALQCCRGEVNQHLTAMEELKNSFSCELAQRETCLRQMKEDMRRLYDELREKGEANNCLERNLNDIKSRYHQTCGQLKEMDSRLACCQEKVQQLECQNSRDKQQACKDLEDCERRASQCNSELCATQNELRRFKRSLQERDEELHAMTEERDCLNRDLTHEKEESCSYRERALGFENDNKEICRLLQQKVKRIKELEQALCCKEQELEQCSHCVDELNCRIRKMNTEMGGDDGLCDELKNQLHQCKIKLQSTEAELEETKKKLDWAVKEMECLACEVKRLTCELEDAKKEICEKCSLIEDLQQVIQHAEHDLESRMRRADEQINMYERDIQEKSRMLADCEEKCLRFQHCLSDKELELDACQQKMCRVCTENTALTNKSRELEECRDSLQRSNNEMRGQLSELCQELSVCKDQYSCQSSELSDVRRDFECTQRELQKCQCELESLRLRLQDRQKEICCLTEEKNAATAKASNLQCRLEAETTQLQQQMSDLKCRLEAELEQLKQCQCQLEDTNSSLMQKVSSCQRQSAQMEKTYCQKLDAMCRENNMIRTKLGDREDQLQAAKDCLTVKESEIMRLKLRLCSLDRCAPCPQYQYTPGDCSGNYQNNNMNSQKQSSQDGTAPDRCRTPTKKMPMRRANSCGPPNVVKLGQSSKTN